MAPRAEGAGLPPQGAPPPLLFDSAPAALARLAEVHKVQRGGQTCGGGGGGVISRPSEIVSLLGAPPRPNSPHCIIAADLNCLGEKDSVRQEEEEEKAGGGVRRMVKGCHE